MHQNSTFVTLMIVAAVLLTSTADVGANPPPSPEQKCRHYLYRADAKHMQCVKYVRGRTVGGYAVDMQASLSKCRLKYAKSWDKLVAAGAGSTTCVGDRWTDNGDGTVTDHLTTLQWEQKTDLDGVPNGLDPHDADNAYSWSATTSAADGTVFANFLETLNGGACFAGHCDWRLPTVWELHTILAESYPCLTSPCIPAIFGPTGIDLYWSSTPRIDLGDTSVLLVRFGEGYVGSWDKTSSYQVRAVRGGL